MFCVVFAIAQKPTINSSAYSIWPSLDRPTMTNNGNYVMYSIRNVPIGSSTLVVQEKGGNWKKEFIGGLKNTCFTSDNKFLMFLKGRDTLGILRLGTDRIEELANISSFQLLGEGEHQTIVYRPILKESTLILMNLKTRTKEYYQNVTSWQYSLEHNTVIISQQEKQSGTVQVLKWLDLTREESFNIWKGSEARNLVIDPNHPQLVFSAGDCLFFYERKLGLTRCLEDSMNDNVGDGFKFSGIQKFSKSGRYLFLYLVEKEKPKPIRDAVEVWSYKDTVLASEFQDAASSRYLAALNLKSHNIVRFQSDREDQMSFPARGTDTLALVTRVKRGIEQWSVAYKVENQLVSIRTGKSTYLPFLDGNRTVAYSKFGKYLVFYDINQQNYFSYEIATKIVRNLTKGLNVSWGELERNDFVKNQHKIYPRNVSSSLWLGDDESILVCDTYDIWKLDPLNRKRPINLTNSYGKRQHILFNYTSPENVEDDFRKRKVIYLNAFNIETKENGFYKKELNRQGDPYKLTMGPQIYCTNSGYLGPSEADFAPIKAKDAGIYIVRRMSASEFPNYFSTTDFENFVKLTDLNPEKQYNWYTTELHSWKSLDGRMLKGILYKPENFDPNKRYPVVFNYYERKSDILNAFIKPEPLCNSCNINIPTYVSQGYLVFCPDIYYKIGDPMQGTYDAVVSGANYLSTLPFVNANRMGLQGCSFGGIQTNYLIANTNLFAAACSVVGWSDWVSSYGSLILGEGRSEQGIFEDEQPRMGASLWEIPDVYLKNSAILKVHKITTPLLMMNNKLDGIIPYYDATAFFSGLRRMGKKAWMLSYPNGGHGVGGKDAEDFSIRMMQFFDHYLKDKPAPVWMTKGIPSSKQGLIDGYEFDKENKTPGPGLLKPEEQLKIDSLLTRKPISTMLK